MISCSEPGFAPRSEWRAGWKLVLSTAMGVGASSVHYHSVGVMIIPLEQAMGWSRSEISSGLLIVSVTGMFCTVLAGLLADRIGVRRVAITGLFFYAFAFAAIGFSGPSIASWYAAWGVMAVAASVSSGMIWNIAIVSRFEKHRGLALALTLSGSGVYIAIVPPVMLAFVDNFDWRAAYFGMGAFILLAAAPVALAFFRDAHDLRRVASPDEIIPDARSSKTGLNIPEALQGRQMWQIAVSFFSIAILVGTLLVHMQPMLIEAGFKQKTAAFVVSIIGPSLIAGRLIAGTLLDRYPTRAIAGVVPLFAATSCLLLLQFDGSLWVAILAAILLGAATGAEGDLLGFVVARYLGSKNFGSLAAVVAGIFGVGMGLSPVLAGASYDALGSYNPLLITCVVAALLASTLFFTLGRPPRY